MAPWRTASPAPATSPTIPRRGSGLINVFVVTHFMVMRGQGRSAYGDPPHSSRRARGGDDRARPPGGDAGHRPVPPRAPRGGPASGPRDARRAEGRPANLPRGDGRLRDRGGHLRG